MKMLLVGGTFDDEGGKPSKIITSLAKQLRPEATLNGGTFDRLFNQLLVLTNYDVVLWFANVPNNKPKLVREIKKKHPKCLLVTSKRNIDGDYSFEDLVFRALELKSNLFVEIVQKENRRLAARVADPLGNVFGEFVEDFGIIAKVLKERLAQLYRCTRIGSTRAGNTLGLTPDHPEFFELIREYATTFHELIHVKPEAANRFLGNASFRCERGFPSFRDDEMIFVSRRNVDKRFIDRDAFVAVAPRLSGEYLSVKYYGGFKPSVDTPIQLFLYDYYKNVNFMLHSHTYIKDAPFTENVIPCGALQEGDEIAKLFPNKDDCDFRLNIRGHGSLVCASSVEYLREIPYVPRSTPEIHVFQEAK